MIIEENKGRVKIISKIRFSKSDLYYFKFEDRDPRNFYKYMYLTSGLFSWWGWHLVDDAGCRGLPGYRYIYTIAICEEFAELQICYAKRCKIRTWPTLAHETSGNVKKVNRYFVEKFTMGDIWRTSWSASWRRVVWLVLTPKTAKGEMVQVFC